MRSLISPLLLVALVATAPLAAAPAKYLAGSHTDVLTLLAPPPAPGSQEDQVDMAAVLKVYATATPAESALAKAEGKLNVFDFHRVLGPWFQEDKLPKS